VGVTKLSEGKMTKRRIVLAEYFTTPDTTLLFIVRSDFNEPRVTRLNITVEHIKEFALNNFGRGPWGSDPSDVDEDEWQERFGGLVSPIVEWAEPEDIIWFVPHDVIHYLPLHSLKVEGDYLIERNPVCYSPSSSVMRYCHNKRKGTRKKALILADSRPERPLLFAREQALSIASLPGLEAEIYLGTQATKTLVKRKLAEDKEGIDILHFACHGFFDQQQALKSGIMLAPESQYADAASQAAGGRPADLGESNLTAEEIFGLEMQADLVTLSACESGVSERRPGDELIGLTRALIYAGTPSVAVSLWSVDELSTDILMRNFYESLLDQEKTKVDALREAQRYMRRFTMGDTITYVEGVRRHPELDAALALYLDLIIAETHLAARDYAVALNEFQDLGARAGQDADVKRRVEGGVWRATVGLESGARADYEHPLYDNPYYWAPFIIVGDWK
jgi:CHAT domain-containing protein